MKGGDDYYTRLARYLAAAYLANLHGVALGDAYRMYVAPAAVVGVFWRELAERLDKEMIDRVEGAMKEPD